MGAGVLFPSACLKTTGRRVQPSPDEPILKIAPFSAERGLEGARGPEIEEKGSKAHPPPRNRRAPLTPTHTAACTASGSQMFHPNISKERTDSGTIFRAVTCPPPLLYGLN